MNKLLVISDTHLTTKFDQKKFDLLTQLIRSCDQVIINGDFYEDSVIRFEQFIASPWQKLFPLLKEKNTICVSGNHDRSLRSYDYEIFCKKAVKEFVLEQNGIIFYFKHGDRIAKASESDKQLLPRFVVGLISEVAKAGAEFLGRHSLEVYRSQNNRLKRWKLKNLPNEDWLICGHTHLAELDIEAKFANSGLFLSATLASYLTIENGKVELFYVD